MNSRFLFPFLCLLVFLVLGCMEPERHCEAFRTGTFSFTSDIGGVEKTTTFVRTEDMEIDYFEGKADTSSVRWINDCEYVVKKLNPSSPSEEQSIHMKILSTTADSYTFEYSILGSPEKYRGTAIKTK